MAATLATFALAFSPLQFSSVATRSPRVSLLTAQADQSLGEKLATGLRIYQASSKEGLGFKQSVADAIAGEYDDAAVRAEIEASVASAPLVMFTWKSSPACKKAIALLEVTGVTPKIVALDDPWSKGNPIRAQLGRMTKKSSVPSIWIGGEYVGGCDDGPSAEAPGLVPLAFKGELRPRLEAAGVTLSP
jgi:glutaredoxin-related protein|tara:strand:+ start:1592 stop:2158 length:567 start_codon:yes stop_codon:yes gene_type:complete